jgi:hypothetical protein
MFINSMLYQLFAQYTASHLVISSISHGNWGDDGCLGRGGYLGIKRAGAEGRGRKGG